MIKKGMTLIELMVAMTIFITVMTLAVGGFIAISRSRILMGSMKNSQQKIRVANEMIIRYAKQAEYVQVPSDKRSLVLYFDINQTITAKKFVVTEKSTGHYQLSSYNCAQAVSDTTCLNNNWGDPLVLIGEDKGGVYLNNGEVFSLNGVLPSVLDMSLSIKNEVAGFVSLNDSMTIRNAIILEALK